MRYLFLVNIGPVQDFIASARRTRDLHFGSWLLSELARAAARELVAHNGLENLIFPAPADVKMLNPYDEFMIANKIIAQIRQHPQDLGLLVRQAVIDQLHKIRDQAYKSIRFQSGMRSIAEAQVEDLIELLWVALPYDDGQHYQQTRKRLEALMAARKNTRDFGQTTLWQAFIPKSSIDGKLESVIPEYEYPSIRDSEDVKHVKIRLLYDYYGAGPAERLSGVDLLKRKGVTAFSAHFPSTSHIAAIPFLERLRVLKDKKPHLTQVKDAWNRYTTSIKQYIPDAQLERIPDRYPSHLILERYDGSMLLEDRLVDLLYEPGISTNKNPRLKDAKRALNDFYQLLDQQFDTLGYSHARPNPYYALLRADGDGMGSVIDEQAEQGEKRHQQLSRQLAFFAGRVRAIVEERYRGALVYSGGDDVVAFLPLDTVLECARELSRQFRDALRNFTSTDTNQLQKRHPTLSVGVAIVHHLDALGRARSLAQEAEHRAKAVEGKNALAITMSKRSGEDYNVAGQWNDLDRSLQRMIEFCQQGAVPAGTAYELRDLALRLGIPMHDDQQIEQEEASSLEVVKLDALRILQRKLYVPVGKFEKKQAEEIERFFKARLGIEQNQPQEQMSIEGVSINEFVNELIIAQMFADAKELAVPGRKGK